MKSILRFKYLVAVSLFLLLLIPIKAYSQSNFEGEIQMKMGGEDNSTTVNYYVKGDKFRFESAEHGGMGASIWDTKNNKMIVLMTSAKKYMEFPLDSFGKQVTSDDTSMAKIKKNLKNAVFTGNTKKILGYDCKEVVYHDPDDGSTLDLWYTTELGTFMFYSVKSPFGRSITQGDIPQEIKDLFKNGFFPMQVITKDKDGSVEHNMEVTQVKKESLSDDMFTPPSDYQKMTMPSMYQNMQKNNN
jgi:Domain of unknown function (DUF4412)